MVKTTIWLSPLLSSTTKQLSVIAGLKLCLSAYKVILELAAVITIFFYQFDFLVDHVVALISALFKPFKLGFISKERKILVNQYT